LAYLSIRSALVLTNNVLALAALANGRLPMRRVAEFEAERRHLLEMELRQSGFLREGGAPAGAGQGEYNRHERGREKIYRSNALGAHPQ